jgi:hypothetical protein
MRIQMVATVPDPTPQAARQWLQETVRTARQAGVALVVNDPKGVLLADDAGIEISGNPAFLAPGGMGVANKLETLRLLQTGGKVLMIDPEREYLDSLRQDNI